MANGFQGPPAADFYSQLSGLGDVIAANRTAQAKRDAFAQATMPGPDGQIDFGKAVLGLAQVDPQAAALLAQRQNHQDTLKQQAEAATRQAARDKVTDSHWSSDYALRKSASERSGEDKFTVQKVENPDGTTSFYRVKTTGSEGLVPTGAPPAAAATNPFSAGGKFNGDQGKAAGFTDRMLQSEGVLSGVGPGVGYEGPPAPGVQDQGSNVTQTGLSKIPGVGNFAISNERQKYNQAKADFINSQLRRESGAAIAASEFENADRQYFPVPGDKPEVIKQKAANRRAAVEAMGREGGGSYKPKYNFDEAGGIQPYGKTAPKSEPAFRAPPRQGEVRDGYMFKGGNPGDPASWAKVPGQ